MIRVNFIKKVSSDDALQTGEQNLEPPLYDSTEEIDTEQQKKKKGGMFKALLLVIILAAASSTYFMYTKGWDFRGVVSSPDGSLVIADEAAMEEPRKEKPKPTRVKKSPVKKLSSPITRTESPKKSPTPQKPVRAAKTKSVIQTNPVIRTKSVVQAKTGREDVRQGRIILDVFSAIITSLEEEMGELRLSIADNKIILALGLNSRDDAALLLRSIRQRWPKSNLRAVRFKRSEGSSGYAYSTQFDGNLKFLASGKTANQKRKLVNLSDFKTFVNKKISDSAILLVKFDAKQVSGNLGEAIAITASGSPDSIALFVNSLIKSDASFTVSRASVMSVDGAVSTLSLYITLIDPEGKSLS